MTPSARPTPSSAVFTAAICAGVVTAQFVAGKAARDALFLGQLDVTALPAMVIAASIFSIALVAVNAKGVSRLSPARFIPWAFGISALLLLVEWGIVYAAPQVAAVLVYLHISGLGPILGSGFWLVASERFDPRTAKKNFGRITAAGTFGGLLGGLLAERVAVLFGVAAMLPILALLNIVCAWQVKRLAATATPAQQAHEFAPELTPEPAWSGVRVLAETPYLRHLALLVLLGTTSAALIDYVFKVQATAAFGTGEGLLRFFAIYYAAISLLSFVLQTSISRAALERLGLAFTTATPSIALIAAVTGAFVAPGVQSVVVARGAESVFRGSLFRAGYEVFYTPIPAAEKRAAKSLIDVAFDRLGDAAGGGLIRMTALAPAMQLPAIMLLIVVCSAAAIAVATRLNRGYVQALERSLRNRAVELDLSDAPDRTTRLTMMNTLWASKSLIDMRRSGEHAHEGTSPGVTTTASGAVDPEIQEIMWIRSRDRERTQKVLNRKEGLTPALIPHVIPLLAWDPVANDAIWALRAVAQDHVGALADALLNPNEHFAVRRRVARVMGACRSQRAADALLQGLDDTRFEVRLQCARSLAFIKEREPGIRIDEARIYEVVRREVAVGRPVWEGRRLLDKLDDGKSNSRVDEFVRSRANQSLAHVFTLLALVLPAEPLQIALRGLHTEDQNLRGTTLEYLESVLPPTVREPLWPFLEDGRANTHQPRPREEVLAALVRSNHSIMMNLEEIQRREKATQKHG